MSAEFGGPGSGDNIQVVTAGNQAPFIRNVSRIMCCGWIQLTAALAASAQIIRFATNPGSAFPNLSRLEIQLTSTQLIQTIFRQTDAGVVNSFFSVFVVPIDATGQFPNIHFCVVYDLVAATQTLYVNGVFDSTNALVVVGTTTDNTDTGNTQIGYDGASGAQYFPGKISDLRLYQLSSGFDFGADHALTLYHCNGHDGFVGNARDQLQMRYLFDGNGGGTALTVADCPDVSGAKIVPFPQAVAGPPTYRDFREAFRRIVC